MFWLRIAYIYCSFNACHLEVHHSQIGTSCIIHQSDSTLTEDIQSYPVQFHFAVTTFWDGAKLLLVVIDKFTTCSKTTCIFINSKHQLKAQHCIFHSLQTYKLQGKRLVRLIGAVVYLPCCTTGPIVRYCRHGLDVSA